MAELRRRLLICVIALVITTGFSFFFARRFFEILKRPIQSPEFQPVFTEMTEMLGTYFKVALLSGLILAMPVIIYQLVMFISPGLTRREKKYLFSLLPGVIICFGGGVAFAYFVLLPPALRFLLAFGGDIAEPMIKIGNYVSLVSTLMFWVGVIFETPILIFFLAWIGALSPQTLARRRKWAILGAFILGGVITPTFDPLNQTLVAVSIVVLYEIGILLARLAWRGKRAVPLVEAAESRH